MTSYQDGEGVYITSKEALSLSRLRFSIKNHKLSSLTEMGIVWVHERGQYEIIDKKKWLLAKIRYDI